MNKYIHEYTGRFVVICMLLGAIILPAIFGYYYFWQKKHPPCNVYWVDKEGNTQPAIVCISSYDTFAIIVYSEAVEDFMLGKNSWENYVHIVSPFIETRFFVGKESKNGIMTLYQNNDSPSSMFDEIYVDSKFVHLINSKTPFK